MSIIDENNIISRILRVFEEALSLNLGLIDESVQGSDLSLIVGLDSLAILEFVAGLEEEFNMEIEMERLNTEFLGDLEALVAYFAERLGTGHQD